jgi:hypothetical protein
MLFLFSFLCACSPDQPDLQGDRPVVDADGDGYAAPEDCDDTDPSVHPGAEDTWYDGLDADCAGNDDHDQDADGIAVGADCDDTDPEARFVSPERCGDGVDNDCNGAVDGVTFTDHHGAVADLTGAFTAVGGVPQVVELREAGTVQVCEGNWVTSLVVGADVRIVGEGAERSVLSGGGAATVLAVDGHALVLQGLTVRDGLADRPYSVDPGAFGVQGLRLGGGLACVDGAVQARDVVFEDNEAEAGAAMLALDCALELVDVDLRGNHATVWAGGGIFAEGSTIEAVAGTWQGNLAADSGGALRLVDGRFTARATAFESNAAPSGGALYLWEGAHAALTGVDFVANTAGTGGAIQHYGGELTLRDVEFTGNRAEVGGGLAAWVYREPQVITVVGADFVGNEAYDRGGAMEVGGAQLIVEDARFEHNFAEGTGARGGAVVLDGVSSAFYEAVFSGNGADQLPGGGLYAHDSLVACARCSFLGNHALTGGGVFLDASAMTLTDGLLEDNEAATEGGAVRLEGHSELSMERVTVSGNRGGSGGAIDATAASAVDVHEALFLANAADRGGALTLTDGASLRVDYAAFVVNAAMTSGGAIYMEGATASGSACDFGGNTPEDALVAGVSYTWGQAVSFSCGTAGC